MTPNRMFLDVSVSPKEGERKRYNKHLILIRLLIYRLFSYHCIFKSL
jgi:hypothetical protein